MTNEQLVSSAVDALTIVIEDDKEDITIRRGCGKARDEAVNALLNFRAATPRPIQQEARVSA